MMFCSLSRFTTARGDIPLTSKQTIPDDRSSLKGVKIVHLNILYAKTMNPIYTQKYLLCFLAMRIDLCELISNSANWELQSCARVNPG